jgi:uncharacterized protein YfbU (UPF0304 family)
MRAESILGASRLDMLVTILNRGYELKHKSVQALMGSLSSQHTQHVAIFILSSPDWRNIARNTEVNDHIVFMGKLGWREAANNCEASSSVYISCHLVKLRP